MLATLIIEFSLAAYTLVRYKLDTIGRLVAACLISLATFQVAEYEVCTGHGLGTENWSRLGFVAITLLPALGLHLLYVLAQKPDRRIVRIGYATMTSFVVYFLTYASAFVGHKCTGNYVIFQVGVAPAIFYAAYYYGWLVTVIILGNRWVKQLRMTSKKQRTRLEAIQSLVIGYLLFLVPTAAANTVKPETRQGIPSIMCGFAVIFAVLLALYLLPRCGQLRSSKK